MIEVITFDLDDTLWSLPPVIESAELRLYHWLEAQAPALTDRFTLAQLTHMRREFSHQHTDYRHQISRLRIDALVDALTLAGYADKQALNIATRGFEVFLEARHEVEIFAEAPGVLEELSGRYRLGALTNGNADISRLPIHHWFEFSFSAEQLNASKPAPDHFHAAMRATGVGASQIVHVGDSIEHDVQAALDAGCHAVWFNPNREDRAFKGAVPQQVFSLRELPAAIERIAAGIED